MGYRQTAEDANFTHLAVISAKYHWNLAVVRSILPARDTINGLVVKHLVVRRGPTERNAVKRLHRLLSAGTAAALAVTLASCASSNRDATTTSSSANNAPGSSASDTGSASATGGATSDGTLIFGAPGKPKMFDPLYADDGETFRVTRQITEGLVAYKVGKTELEPALAESWTPSADGVTWTFKLRTGVKFTDGTDFNADAVCYNFDRMYGQSGTGATLATYWSTTMGGFKGQVGDDGKPVPSLYKSCAVTDAATAVITINSVSSKFPGILGLPSFSIQSPTALKKYDADNVTAAGDAFTYPAYALEHPTGTGPFVLTKYDTANNTIELTRNDAYWGDKAKVKTIIFKVISDTTARKQELDAGTIDGYDLPSAGDWDALKAAGDDVLVRGAFNVMYLGLNPTHNPALLDLRVRQAIAYALNKSEFVSSQLPEGSQVALNLYPDSLEGWTDQVEKYAYDPQKAKDLLAAAGQSNLTLNFWWPSDVSRQYMPEPNAIFNAFKADLEAVGIKINEVVKVWNQGYLTGVDDNQADAFILGWNGDYPAPDNFIGTFFSNTTLRFGTGQYPWGTQLSDELKAADAITDPTARAAAYVALNKKLLGEYLPAIPISHSPSALVVSSKVQGLIASPLADERFAFVSKS